MNFSTGVNGDLIAGTDGEARVVVGPVVHETFARRRVGLLVESAWYGELGADGHLEAVLIHEWGWVYVYGGCISARWDI